MHVVDYEKLHKIIQDEQSEGDVYIRFPIYLKDPAVDTATLVEMVDSRARKAESRPEPSRSRAAKEKSSGTDESHESSDEGDYEKAGDTGSGGVALEESATRQGSARRSSRLVSKPRQSYYDGENAEVPTLKETRPLRASKTNAKSHPSKKLTAARPRSTLATTRAESIEEISAQVRVISQFLKEEFEVFTGFKWNVRKALELKFRQERINARMTYYCGQIKGTGGALQDPSKRTGQGGRKSSVRYDCGGRLVFFMNLTNQVCVVRYKHNAHPPRPGFSPVAIPDAAIGAMQKLAQEEGDLQDATGQEMYDHLVANKLIRREQFQPIRIALRWLQIRESRNAKMAPASSPSTSTPRSRKIKNASASSTITSIPKAIPTTNTKNKAPGKPVDSSSEDDEEAEEDEKESENTTEEDVKAEPMKEADPTDNYDDDEEVSEYEEAVESQSQERWATPDLIEEESESPDVEMEVDENPEAEEVSEAVEDEDSDAEDFADQLEVDESTAARKQDAGAMPEIHDELQKQRDIADIVERMDMLEKDMVDPTKTDAEIEAIEKELDLLNSFLTDMNF